MFKVTDRAAVRLINPTLDQVVIVSISAIRKNPQIIHYIDHAELNEFEWYTLLWVGNPHAEELCTKHNAWYTIKSWNWKSLLMKYPQLEKYRK